MARIEGVLAEEGYKTELSLMRNMVSGKLRPTTIRSRPAIDWNFASFVEFKKPWNYYFVEDKLAAPS